MKHLNYNHELLKIKSTEKLREIFNEFVALTKEVLTEFNYQKKPDYHQVVYQNLLQRLYIGVSAIDTLFDTFNKNKYFKYPIAIQMRTCILDCITIAYLTLFIEDRNEFREQVVKLNHPVAREINDQIQELIKKDKSDYKKHFELAALHFPENFTNANKIKLKKIKELKPGCMANALNGTPLEFYIEAYKLYKHYSKYEHFGTFSKTLLELNSEIDFDKFTFSTYFILQASLLSMKNINVETTKLREMQNIIDKIKEVEKTFD
jgi:hypothetical protein